jgi:hypothetical protein
MKLVQRSYPTCTIIDSTLEDNDFITDKCHEKPMDKDFGQDGKYSVRLCTGSFNVYILDIKEKPVE